MPVSPSFARVSVLALNAIGAIVLMTAFLAGSAAAAEPTVIELTQVACQFVESENGVDRGFAATERAEGGAAGQKNWPHDIRAILVKGFLSQRWA